MERSEINKTIAKACGWDFDPKEAHQWGSRGKWCKHPGSCMIRSLVFAHSVPDYYGSLDACHDFEKILLKDTNSLWFPYCRALHIATTGMGEHANAPQRCEAFLKTTGGWIEPSTGGKP